MTIAVLISTKDDETTTDVVDLETLLTQGDVSIVRCTHPGCTALATAECHYCEGGLCAEHNMGYKGQCLVQYDACAPCVTTKEKQAEAHHRRDPWGHGEQW